MKKITLAILIALSFQSCKKETGPTEIGSSIKVTTSKMVFPNTTTNSMARGGNPLVVNSRGHLEFKTPYEFVAFLDELQTKTRGEMLSYFQSINFASLASLGNIQNDSTLIADIATMDFILGSDSIVEVEGTLIKPIKNMTELLTIHQSNLNAYSSSLLSNNVYNSNYMNLLTLSDIEINGDNVFKFLETHRNGYEGQPNSVDDFNRRKMFGSTNQTVTTTNEHYDLYGNCVIDTHTYTVSTTYFFWIANHHEPVYQGTTTSPGTHC